MSEVTIEFDRDLVSGHRKGDQVRVEDTPQVQGMVKAGVAHYLDPVVLDPEMLAALNAAKVEPPSETPPKEPTASVAASSNRSKPRSGAPSE